MSTIDQQFVEFIVKSIVSNPDAVVVNRTVDERGVLLELNVDNEDLGRVIGKRGSGAQALRTMLRALGTKNDARYNLKIVDDGQSPQRTESTNSVNSTEGTEEVPSETVIDDSSKVAQTRKELEDLDDLDI